MKTIQIVIVLFLFLSWEACRSNFDNSLDDFFEELVIQIDNPEEILKFKRAPFDAVSIYFSDNFWEEFMTLYEMPKHKKDVDDFRLKIENKFDKRTAQSTLAFVFHAKLNGKKIDDMLQLATDIHEYREVVNQEMETEKIIYEKESLKIIEATNQRWYVGDTVGFILPVRIEETSNSGTAFFRNGYPYTLDYSVADDTLKVKGMLMQKDYDYSPVNKILDSPDLIFTVKIVSYSDTRYQILGERYQVGDELSISLKNYGRPLE